MDREEGVSVRLIAPAPPSDFDHSYKLSYVVTLAAHQLSTDLHVVNTDSSKEFKFQALLHSYLAVPDVSKISITGIDSGVQYKDKVKKGAVASWEGGALKIDQEVDRWVI
jgi:glucose-6-phosphate 1-epimerase